MSVFSLLGEVGIGCYAEVLPDSEKLPQEYDYNTTNGCSVLNGPVTKYKIYIKNKTVQKRFFFCVPRYSNLEAILSDDPTSIMDAFFEQKILQLGCVNAYDYDSIYRGDETLIRGLNLLKDEWGWNMSRSLFLEASERVRQDFSSLREVLGKSLEDVLFYFANAGSKVNLPLRMAIAIVEYSSPKTLFQLMEEDLDSSVRQLAKQNNRLKNMLPFI